MIICWRINLFDLNISSNYVSISERSIRRNKALRGEKNRRQAFRRAIYRQEEIKRRRQKKKKERISIIIFLIIEMRPLTDKINGNIYIL